MDSFLSRRPWLRVALLLAPFLPLFAESIPASPADSAIAFQTAPGSLSMPGPWSMTAGNLDRWYSSATLPTYPASTPQDILRANLLDSMAQSDTDGSGGVPAEFDPAYIAMLEAEIVAGPSFWNAPMDLTPSGVVPAQVARQVSAVPEPGTLVLLGAGLFAFAVILANRAARALQPGGIFKDTAWPYI